LKCGFGDVDLEKKRWRKQKFAGNQKGSLVDGNHVLMRDLEGGFMILKVLLEVNGKICNWSVWKGVLTI
jgi:hypothetical protein